jgi:hypothetical protein
MKITELTSKLESLANNNVNIASAYPDDFNDYEVSIVIHFEDEIQTNKRSIAAYIKRFFKENFGATIYIKYDENINGYFFDFLYGNYNIIVDNSQKNSNTMIFSKKLDKMGIYKGNESFKKNVLETSKIANNHQHHIELLENLYPNHTIIPLWTYEHGEVILEKYPSCSFDSSTDAFAAYKIEQDFDDLFNQINDDCLTNY